MALIPKLPASVNRKVHHASVDCSLAHMSVASGTPAAPHRHPHATILYLLKGSCSFILDEARIPMEPGMSVYVPSNALHGFETNDQDLEFLEFFVPGREDFL